jgi:hypothetical protein
MPEGRNCFAIFEDAGIPLDGHRMVGKEAGKASPTKLVRIGLHRAWARSEAVMASSVLSA